MTDSPELAAIRARDAEPATAHSYHTQANSDRRTLLRMLDALAAELRMARKSLADCRDLRESYEARVAALEAENTRLTDAMLRPYEAGRQWWARHSTPLSNSWDFLPVETRHRYILKALTELVAESQSEPSGKQP